MDRAERTGLGIAVAGHVLLFGLLSVGFLATPNPLKLKQQPIEVSLVKDVGLEATAPQSVTPPAQSIAPDQGEPEDAAPPPQLVAQPEPQPQTAPPQPTTAPVAQPKPAPASKPAPTAPKSPPKPAAAKPSPAAPRSDPLASVMRGIGSSDTATTARPRGSRLGDSFLKGLSSEPSKSTSTAPRAEKIDAKAMASIVQAIARQIQPCADRQVNPGPGANQIVTTLSLRLNPDGTLAATPRMVRQTGVDGDNDRYAQRVVDLGVAAFKGCSPLRLPAEYYSTPSGGWNNINYQWQLR